jgi:hypothetical protein
VGGVQLQPARLAEDPGGFVPVVEHPPVELLDHDHRLRALDLAQQLPLRAAVLNDVSAKRLGVAVEEPAQIIRVDDEHRPVVTDVVDQPLQPLQTVQAA